MFTAEIFTKFFEIIGIRGVIIIILLALCGTEGWIIKSNRNKIVDLKVTISTQVSKIKEQNASIDAAAAEAKKVQTALDISEKLKAKISNSYDQLKMKLMNQPIPVDCKSAITELKLQQSTVLKNWNDGVAK